LRFVIDWSFKLFWSSRRFGFSPSGRKTKSKTFTNLKGLICDKNNLSINLLQTSNLNLRATKIT